MENDKFLAVPRDASERLDLLSARPPGWEYILFGYALRLGLARTEVKWRDYHLGYTMEIGPAVALSEVLSSFSDRMSRVSAIIGNLEKVISAQAQEAAFGLPGSPGDAALIEHMGSRLMMMYEQLLDWAQDIRALRLPTPAKSLPEMAVAFIAQPVGETRDFVEQYIHRLETGLAARAAGSEEPINLVMTLKFEIAPAISRAYSRELKKVSRAK